MAFPFCLTNTIDRYTDIGYKYYHNIQQDKNYVTLRPRLPLRFDFNDVEIVKMDPKAPETRAFANHYRRFGQFTNMINPENLYQIKRTGYSIFNTFLFYVLSLLLIVASVINMKKIVVTLQNDQALSLQDKMMFRLSFIFSFLVVLFLLCFVGLSMFELYRNQDIFSSFIAHNFRYKNIKIQDGNILFSRAIILFFVICSLLLSLAETFNLFFMKPEKLSILILLLPIFLCFILLMHLYQFSQRRNVV